MMSRILKTNLGLLSSIKKRMLSSVNDLTKICIVGGGPAGFYAAQQLIKLLPSTRVDIYERLPVPFGLVRFGVAPDHPDVKNVINTFTKTGKHPNLRFFGNLTLGRDFSIADLQHSYHAVILSYGAEHDNQLGVEGEDLKNVLPARRFVGWYNGLPADKDLEVDLDSERAVIIGQGNVAVDVARILLSSVDSLRATDITEHALERLSRSKVKHVDLIGRRGPLQVAFTIKELRELLKLPGVRSVFNKTDFNGVEESIPFLPRSRKRLIELLNKSAMEGTSSGDKTLNFIFRRSPTSIAGDNSVKSVNFAINDLQGEDWENQKAVSTGKTESRSCELLMRSIGYKGVNADPALPFDTRRGVVVNENGLISPGLYCCGWLSTGPTGVIVSTMTNAFLTAQLVHSHILNGTLNVAELKPGSEAVVAAAVHKGTQVVTFSDWERIDQEEERRGKAKGKPREKILSVYEMLDIAAR